VATWATKIVLVLDSSWKSPVLAPSLKEWFFREQRPIPHWTIWAGAMNPAQTGTHMRLNTLAIPPPAPYDDKVYVATFRVFHLILQVFGPMAPGILIRRQQGFGQFVQQLWPRSTDLVWPPPAKACLRSEKEFEDLANAFETRAAH
jgi:hypothetical protein